VVGVGVVEQQRQLELLKLQLQSVLLGAQLPRQLGIVVDQLGELGQVAPAALELIPDRALVAVLGSLAGQRRGPARVVPGIRCG
jgi:hypothetical protein